VAGLRDGGKGGPGIGQFVLNPKTVHDDETGLFDVLTGGSGDDW
jgi:hypothetical protein